MSCASSTIAFLSDFGLSDCFAGIVKGVIRDLAPAATVVDLTHQVPPGSILIGAAHLSQSAPYFPAGTVFLAVVDPGVGTERRALAASSGGCFFVAPDNGLLSFVLNDEARVHSIENSEWTRKEIGGTFHGRDVFAPVAAHLARGVSLEEFGPAVDERVEIPWPLPASSGSGLWRLPIIAVDHFGNLITSLRIEDLSRLNLTDISVRVHDKEIGAISPTFGAVGQGEWLAYWGSGGVLEVAINGGNAAVVSRLGAGDSIELRNPARH